MIAFDGQQEGERVLFEIRPHPIVMRFALLRIAFTASIFVLIVFVIGTQSSFTSALFLIPFVGIAAAAAGAVFWVKRQHEDTRAYITDRRVMRFERISPFMVAKRALFWNEVLKAKAYEPNLLLKSYNIGTLIIEPQVQTEENVIIAQVSYAQDLANYIDKILFTFKNTPADITKIKPFVPKPKGERD